MNEHQHPKWEELRESWIESLLTSATNRADHSDRIARAMSQIENDHVISLSKEQGRKRTGLLQWGWVGTAAAVLFLLFLLNQNGGTQSAMAAIQRSLDVAAQPTTRKYLLQVNFLSSTGKRRKVDNDLYVQGNNRLALRHPGLLPGRSFWIGHDGSESWVVPAIGPVIKGDQTIVRRWLSSREDLDTPYLHVTTILTRMSQGYRLEQLDDEFIAISDIDTVECQHVRAKLKSSDDPDLPDTIELWASRETGMAVRLAARWDLAEGEAGRESITITFHNEELSLPNDWFTAEGHFEGRRPILRTDASDN